MNIGNKLIFQVTMIWVVIIYGPSQNNGEISFNQVNFKDAFQDITIHKRIKSYVSESYYSLINKAIENVALIAIKKQRTKLREDEPVVYEFTKEFDISEDQFNGQGSIQNVTLPDGSQFIVTNLTSFKQENKLNFEIFLKKFTANDISYKVKGKILTAIPVNGRGKINTTTHNATVEGKIVYQFINKTIQIKKMQLHYSFDNFALTITGLNVPLLSPAALNKLLTREVTNYLRKNEKKICAEASKKITKKINKKLKNFSFFDFIKSLWASLSPSKKEKQSLNQLKDLADSNFE